jgi:hypothetical protein
MARLLLKCIVFKYNKLRRESKWGIVKYKENFIKISLIEGKKMSKDVENMQTHRWYEYQALFTWRLEQRFGILTHEKKGSMMWE